MFGIMEAAMETYGVFASIAHFATQFPSAALADQVVFGSTEFSFDL